MSFSAEWLALREPVDHRSTSAKLRAEVAKAFAHSDPLRIVDMGCGSGSNLRGLAPGLPQNQHWTLVDWDAALLAHAREALTQWAETSNADGQTLVLEKAGKHLRVNFLQADLARHVENALDIGVDLVTAAAFFDLVSEDWIEAFAKAMALRKLPLYTVLTYDGHEHWSPAHRADAAMNAAFHAHQRSDKGFGPAAGPAAAGALARAFAHQGYGVQRESSPWNITPADGDLLAELARGAANAVRETGLVDSAEIASWLAARVSAQTCIIGHEDVFARP
jgi:SAM-dependent methyltransferase